MIKKYGILILLAFLINGASINASTIDIDPSPTDCLVELKRRDVTGTAQRKRYKLDQNERQRRHHKDHNAQHGGKLKYPQDHDLHIEAVITDNRQFKLYLSDDDLLPKVIPNLRLRVGVVNHSKQYIYLKLEASNEPSIFEVKLPDLVSGKELELNMTFPKQSHIERVLFELVKTK